jgi:hypothetical protein
MLRLTGAVRRCDGSAGGVEPLVVYGDANEAGRYRAAIFRRLREMGRNAAPCEHVADILRVLDVFSFVHHLHRSNLWLEKIDAVPT